ncbi:hypothetical protein A0H81_02827 [Grifola frondosa]|uniref:Uncharacterized protein n=1 Tax=Grifola frondosa TaxID=5627 RepID=A0A1C7MJX7_GRIFR|nr:hypothetical protein A0H81_02827 [Grifola frondosa]
MDTHSARVKSALDRLCLTQAAENVQLLGLLKSEVENAYRFLSLHAKCVQPTLLLLSAHAEFVSVEPPEMIDLSRIAEDDQRIPAGLRAAAISGTPVVGDLGPNRWWEGRLKRGRGPEDGAAEVVFKRTRSEVSPASGGSAVGFPQPMEGIADSPPAYEEADQPLHISPSEADEAVRWHEWRVMESMRAARS